MSVTCPFGHYRSALRGRELQVEAQQAWSAFDGQRGPRNQRLSGTSCVVIDALGGDTCSAHRCRSLCVSWWSVQFFITTVVCGWLDNRHVVFGEVKDGYKIIEKMESLGSGSGKPRAAVVIKDCGVLTE